jgi:polyisoprenoid-binding protein YceI
MARKWMAMCLSMMAAVACYAEPATDRVVVIVKDKSHIEFKASSTFAKVVGVFKDWDATFKMNSDSLANATLEFKIVAESVHTGSGFKDKEVKGKNFFNVEQYPEIKFASTGVLADADPKKFTMTGNLTLRGITRPVTAEVNVVPEPAGVERVAGAFTFNRRDFGMTKNMPFNKVADIIKVEFELELPADAVAAAQPAGI